LCYCEKWSIINIENKLFEAGAEMNIQIYGVKKSFDTQKAERYFKERKIKYQFIDLKQKEIGKRELDTIKAAVGLNNLIDVKARDYEKLKLGSIRSAEIKTEMLLKNPSLYRVPIVRNGKLATVGYEPEIWQGWE
jgi:arsenate reductase (glutaredoxin)